MERKLTLLSEEQIWGKEQLDIMRKYGTKCAVTDLAILTGCYVSSYYKVNEYNSLAGSRTSWWWIRSYDSSNNVRVVYDDGHLDHGIWIRRHGAVRPALQSSIIYSLISPNKGRVRGYNGVYEVEYGEYPQVVAGCHQQTILEAELSAFNLIRTGRNYTFYSKSYDDYNLGYDLITYDEYEYQGKKYIRVKANTGVAENNFLLSNGEKCRNGEYLWVEVSPVRWLIDEKKGILVSKKALVSGIRCPSKEEKCKGDFEKTEMYAYLNNYMLKDLFQSIALVDTDNISPVEKQKEEILRKLVSMGDLKKSLGKLSKKELLNVVTKFIDSVDELAKLKPELKEEFKDEENDLKKGASYKMGKGSYK